MSAQTGHQSLPITPQSSGRVERAADRARRLLREPNPVWMREMRQSARLVSTPVVLALVTMVMTLLMASIGGAISVTAEPTKVGAALFHTFFSIAFFVVMWVAPAVAAATISSERSNRTWEALLLTGLGPGTIAKGKFLAALTYVSLYLVMLAPVGGLTFLFGGITATEVISAYALLGLFSALAVAFGLTMSSALPSPAVAIVVTLMTAVPLSLVLYVGLGPLLSIAVHELWPAVPAGPPVWLPTAYARSPFGLDYVALLILLPITAATLPAWFFYAITVANMASPSDDRSSGVRHWMCVSIPVSVAAAVVTQISVKSRQPALPAVWAIGITFVIILFCTFVIAGEPLGPSRRITVQWDRQRVTRLRRFLGPGIMKAATLLVLLGTLGLLLETLCGVAIILQPGIPDQAEQVTQVVSFGLYLVAFFIFLVGFIAFVRARSSTSAMPRLLLLGALFLALVGPWILMAIGGALTHESGAAFVLSSPSPTYVFVMMGSADAAIPHQHLIFGAGALCSVAWALVGFGLLGFARESARKRIQLHQIALSQVELQLAKEDQRQREPSR